MSKVSHNTKVIPTLNDVFRTTFIGGRIILTAGVAGLPDEDCAVILAAVRTFDAFNRDNDPGEEYDFGQFEILMSRYCWKIDCYISLKCAISGRR